MSAGFLYIFTLTLILSGCNRNKDPVMHQTIYTQPQQSQDQFPNNSSQLVTQTQQNNIYQTHIQQLLKVLQKEDQDKKKLSKSKQIKLQQAIHDEQKKLNNSFYGNQTQHEKTRYESALEKLRQQLDREVQLSQQEADRLDQAKIRLQESRDKYIIKQQEEADHQKKKALDRLQTLKNSYKTKKEEDYHRQRHKIQELCDLEQALKNSLETKAQEDSMRQQQMLKTTSDIVTSAEAADKPLEGKLVEAGTIIMALQNHLKKTKGRNATYEELSLHLQKEMNISANDAISILDALDIE